MDAQKDLFWGSLRPVEEQDSEGSVRPVEDQGSESSLRPLVVSETLVSS